MIIVFRYLFIGRRNKDWIIFFLLIFVMMFECFFIEGFFQKYNIIRRKIEISRNGIMRKINKE